MEMIFTVVMLLVIFFMFSGFPQIILAAFLTWLGTRQKHKHLEKMAKLEVEKLHYSAQIKNKSGVGEEGK